LVKRLLTVAELAAYLDVAPADLYEFFERGRGDGLPAIRIGGEWHVPLEEFSDWLLRFAEKNKS
jgi:excisionase family DNA binding protein